MKLLKLHNSYEIMSIFKTQDIRKHGGTKYISSYDIGTYKNTLVNDLELGRCIVWIDTEFDFMPLESETW